MNRKVAQEPRERHRPDTEHHAPAAIDQAPEPATTARPMQLLGLCPLLAVSNTVANAAGLALASAVVLIGSCLLIGLTRRLIPNDVRLPCFVLAVATFTTLVDLAMQAYAFDIYQRIALFVQIIVTNCLILASVERVAYREPIGRTLLHALRTAALFAAAILALGAAREALALGFPLAALPPGAFIVAGLLLALFSWLREQPWVVRLRHRRALL